MYIPVILQAVCAFATLLGPSLGLALLGRRKRRSNLIQADLSFTRITYLSKLIGIDERHPCLSPEASLWQVKFVPDEFVTPLPRDSAFGVSVSAIQFGFVSCPATLIIQGVSQLINL